MYTFEIDIDACQADTLEFFGNQVPWALAKSLTSTAFDVRMDQVTNVYPESFKVRNTAFPKQLFRVSKKATKYDPVAEVAQAIDRDWLSRQAEGGVKAGRGGNVAIPLKTKAEGMRTSRGAIKKAMKPRNLKRSFVVSKGDSKLIYQRKFKHKVELLYVLKSSVAIPDRFPFYDRAVQKGLMVFSDHFWSEFDKAVTTSRFFPA
jgi:hypothetical protein